MATNQPISPGENPPPDLPSMPDVSATLTTYLRTFALWCRNGFASKLGNSTALPGVLLMATDAPSGSNPPVYMLEVAGGALALAPVALGSGAVGAPVPVGAGKFLPVDGAGYVEGQILIKSVDDQYAYVAFYDATPTRKGWIGWSAGGDPGLVFNNDASGTAVTIGDDGIVSFTRGTHFPVNAGWIANPDPNDATYSPRVQSVGTNDAYINFLVPSSYGSNFGLNANGNYYQGGWSDGANYWKFWTARDFANPACDHRIKKDVAPLASTWDHVKALKPIRYRHKEHKAKTGGLPVIDADDRERWGFVAHELQETLGATAATGVKDIEDRLQSPNLMMVVAALTRTVQEMQARIETLEAAR